MPSTPNDERPSSRKSDSVMGFAFDKLHHVQLAMPAGAEDDARSFYCDALGLAEVDKPPALAERGGCWFSGDGIEVHLGIEDDFRSARKAHPGVLVDGIDA